GAGAVTAVPPIDGLFAGLADLTQIADYAVHRAIKQKAAFQNGGPMLLHVIGEIFARLFHDLEAEAVDEHKGIGHFNFGGQFAAQNFAATAVFVRHPGTDRHGIGFFDELVGQSLVTRLLTFQRCHFLPALAAAARGVAQRNCLLDRNRSEEHTSELQSRENLVCRLLLEKKKLARTRPRAGGKSTRWRRSMPVLRTALPARRRTLPKRSRPRT